MIGTNQQPTVLIVDDAPENISILGEYLRNDCIIRVATNGEKALKIAGSENPPDLILLDIMMPGMDGYEVCRRLKEGIPTRSIPVIFITAKDGEDDEIKGFELGAVDYVTKPFSPVVVKARVKTHIELKRHREFFESLSFRDGLTGIANRRRFDEYLSASWNFCMRESSHLSLAIIDIDNFKLYNDNYGHQAGDICLAKVAQSLAASVKRKTDLIARYGGEEFACILPETDIEDACEIAENLRAGVIALQTPHAHSSTGKYVTVSVGVTTMTPVPGMPLEHIIEIADKALYKSKQTGRNRVCHEC